LSAAHLIVVWSHSGRFCPEAAFGVLTGISPLEASSGRDARHRLNRFGARNLDRALHIKSLPWP
jgi:hypothetical protein